MERQNKSRLLVCLSCVLITLSVLLLPLAFFETNIFVKRSANTFVGDEKYVEARAEVEAVAAQYEGASIEENVTERVNSKGVATSMVTFTVKEKIKRNGLDFLLGSIGHSEGMTGIGPTNIMRLLLVCLAVSLALAAGASHKTLALAREQLPEKAKRLYLASGVFALIALFCVPAFARSINYTFSRQVDLLVGGHIQNEALLAQLNNYLYDGGASENLLEMLGGLTVQTNWVLWIAFASIFLLLCAITYLRCGELQKTLARGGLYLFVIVLCIFILYPFYVMLITGFRSNAETTDMYFLHMLPTKWVWSNLKDICDRGVLRFLLNSIMLSTGATAIAMLCGIPAAYAMARMNFKGRNLFLGFVIMSQMFSPVVLLVGISQLMNTLHLNDTILGLMLINAAFNQAFAIWLLRGTFVSISPEMEQAACIDGCNTVGALWHILLPMAAPGIVTTLIFVFINSWNEYTISTVLISTPANKPITVGITQFSSFNMIEWQYLFAARLLARSSVRWARFRPIRCTKPSMISTTPRRAIVSCKTRLRAMRPEGWTKCSRKSPSVGNMSRKCARWWMRLSRGKFRCA